MVCKSREGGRVRGIEVGYKLGGSGPMKLINHGHNFNFSRSEVNCPGSLARVDLQVGPMGQFQTIILWMKYTNHF